MPRPSKKTDTKLRKMRAMHQEGASGREIAEALGIDAATAAKWLRDAGLEPNGGCGPRAKRHRRQPVTVDAAVLGAHAAIDEVAAGALPSDRAGVVRHLQARLSQIADLATQQAKNIPQGNANPSIFGALVKIEGELGTRIAELAPSVPIDPETDPVNLEAAATTRTRLARLVQDAETRARCRHCGQAPFAGR